MTHESGATVNNLWPGTSSGEGEARDVRVDVPRTRDAEFTAFVRDSGAYLHRTAYLLCGDPHRAEELVQSTFERVYRTWAKVRPGTQRAYARRILVNLTIDSWRHGHRESFPGDDKIPVASTSDHAGRVVLRDELVRGLAQLSPTQRRVVVLRHLLDLPEAEVARELGLAVGTVKAANSRGLARLRDLLREGAEAIEPVAFDERAVLDRSRAVLRRRRVGQAVGAACVVLLLTLGVVTRGPVPIPGIGTVVLPGGQLVAPLFVDGRADRLGPDPTPAGNTPVDCPEEVPGPMPARPATPGEDLGVLDDPVVVDAADARPLTCYDVDIEVVTGGSENDYPPLPEPGGLSDTGVIWDGVTDSEPDGSNLTEAFVRGGGYRGDEPIALIPTGAADGEPMWPLDVAARGDQMVWGETTGGADQGIVQVRTLRTGGEPEIISGYDGKVWQVALTDDHALWAEGAVYNDMSLVSAALGTIGTPNEFATGVTAFAADDDEVVAAVADNGSGGTSTTSIRLFDLAGGDVAGTTLFEIEHDASAEVTAVAVSDEVVAWTLTQFGAGPTAGTLYVADRIGDRDSIVQLPDGVVDGLHAAGSLITWTSTDNAAANPVPSSYLYRATPSASGYDGVDVARFPGDSVTASLAGNRTAWLESQSQSPRQWLVEGTVTPTLERD